jgi:uncharacterized protein involved in exopolysaccharide biosynthesis
MTDPIELLWKRRWVIVAAVAFGLLAGVIYYVYAPRRFEANVTILPSSQRPAAPVSSGSDAMSRLADLGLIAGGPAVSAARIAAVLQSQSVSDAVIRELSLLRHYDVSHIEQARSHLWSACTATVDRRAELVRLSCQDEQPEVARDIAARLAKLGRDAFARVSSSRSAEERAFLEGQVADARRLADEAARCLGDFQRTHAIVDFPEQAKAVVATLGELEGQRVAKQLQLSYVTAFASAREASATQLQAELRAIDHQLEDLMKTPHPGLFPAALDLPAVGYELAQLMREQKVRETVYVALTERLELLRADEIRDAAVFQILDDAVTPTYRVWPRVEVIPMGGAAAAFFALLLVFVPAWWRGLSERAALERRA